MGLRYVLANTWLLRVVLLTKHHAVADLACTAVQLEQSLLRRTLRLVTVVCFGVSGEVR